MHHHASAHALRGRLVTAVVAMAAAIALVLYLEHGMGVAPCHLCYGERVPCYVGVPLGLLAAALVGRGPSWASVAPTACLALDTAWGTWLGTYHVGVERGWWPGPTSCSSAAGGLTDPRQLLAQLHDLSVTACDRVGFVLLGQSLATWDALLMAGLTAHVVLATLRFARDRRLEAQVRMVALSAA